MEKITLIQSFISFFFLQFTFSFANACSPAACGNTGNFLNIRFPFYLQPFQTGSCGYPGFGLFCNQTRPILNLPQTGDYIINAINYKTQEISVDSGFCIPGRILNFTLDNTPFRGEYTTWFTIYNCSSDFRTEMLPVFTLDCLSNENITVVAKPDTEVGFELSSFFCQNISRVEIPVRRPVRFYGSLNELMGQLKLTWDVPDCRICESKGQMCKFKYETNFDSVVCIEASGKGLAKPVKYVIIIGVGIPAVILITGLACFTVNKIQTFGQTRNRVDVDLLTIPTQQASHRNGLDGLTIESYPKTVFGENGRLTNPNDGVCSICLTDYLPKDVLRTIPKCNHYFHATCIDEWLKRNATCPVCRKSPESSLD